MQRLVVIAIFVFSLFSLLIVQFYRICVIDHEKWKQVAKSQHQTVVTEPFRRGVFYSNTGLKKGHPEVPQPFVIDVLMHHLYIDPLMIPDRAKKEISERVTELLKISQDISSQFYKKSRSRRIATWLTNNDKQALEEWWMGYAKQNKIPKNALYFVKDYKRSYPFGKMLGQVLHTVREDRDEKTCQAIPTGGLEMIFHEHLVGKEGKKVILRSPRFELDSDEIEEAPEDGSDVYLTINHCLQSIAEEELMLGIKKVNAKSGFAVMIDPYTGEILTIAHYPFFDPSNYRDYYNDEEMTEYTRNKAVNDCFEPGSTMKAITITIALKANEELIKLGKRPIFSPHEMVRADQHILPGRIQPLNDMRPHKYLNMYMAIQKSSNIYPAKLVQKIIEELGENWYRKQLVELFGLGLKTGVELPYESPGLIPTPGKTYANGVLEWSSPTPYSLAMGYNLLVNSMQMVRAYSVFANGGYLIEPTIVKKIVKNGKEVKGRTKGHKKVLSEGIVAEVNKAIKYTTKPGGSAPLADIPGYTEMGKTSTSEKLYHGKYSKTLHFTTFIGIFPANQPRFVLFVGIDEPEKKFIQGFGMTHFGGKSAAPIFREIAKRTLQYLGVPPDDPYGYPKSDPRADPAKADWAAEVAHLNEIYNKWNGVDETKKPH